LLYGIPPIFPYEVDDCVFETSASIFKIHKKTLRIVCPERKLFKCNYGRKTKVLHQRSGFHHRHKQQCDH
jgi:hypothetical protein